jgi:hypothetical protein
VIRKLKYPLFGFALLLMAFLGQRCANAVAPTGGPKDTTPPVVVGSVPENHSTNFIGKKIEITFDEYITLDNAKQKVMISPPMKEKPDIRLKNKTVVVKFKEPLAENTTYTINFGESIKDLHEGNLFKDYVYSFSTGDHIDTLYIAGKLLYASNKKPVEDAYVSLYSADRDNLDSLPMSTIPNYITKTDKEGHFHLNGLADKQYLIFALKDANANLYFDLPNEEVAFLNKLVSPTDSTTKDLTLFMFSEVDSTQVLLEKKLVEEGLLRFVFRHPAKDAVIMTPETLPDTFNLVTMHSKEYDTVWWYFTPNVKDSLWVQVKYDTTINDSSRYSLKFKDKNTRIKKKEKLKVTSNTIIKGGLKPGDDFILSFSEPVVRYQPNDSSLFKRDTLVTYGGLTFEPADEYGMKYRLVYPVKADTNYHIEIPDSVFFGIRGRTHDAIKADFHVLSDDEFGNIYITVAPPEGIMQVVVQLTDDKGKVLKEEIIKREQEVMFEYLAPAKYKLSAILDSDGNGKWSTGKYHRRTLSETIVEYKDELDLKAGWDIDLDEIWELSQ